MLGRAQAALARRRLKPETEAGVSSTLMGVGGEPDAAAAALARAPSAKAAASVVAVQATTTAAALPAILAARPPAATAAAAAARATAMTAGARAVGAGPASTSAHFRGMVLALGLAFLTGAAPWSLPAVYLAWAAVALPLRVHEFVTTRRVAFLLEFCYWVNCSTVALLLGPPVPAGWEAAGRALADGPIAAALLVWQCPWEFGSWTAGTSVLLHLLPGLALYARAHHPPPPGAPAALRAILASPGAESARATLASTPPTFHSVWLVPFLAYCVWQVAYGLILQASPLRDVILSRRLDTSYRTLARRAAGANNIWSRICRGRDGTAPAARKVLGYGFLQVLFTAVTLALAAPAHATHATTVAWQAAKFAVPLYFGARSAGDRGPKRSVARLLRDPAFVGAVQAMAE